MVALGGCGTRSKTMSLSVSFGGMSLERKDFVPIAIALIALGVQVGGFTNQVAG
jgi:hypothetical protein